MKGLPVKLDISLAFVSWFIQNLELPVKLDISSALVSCVIQKNVLKTSNSDVESITFSFIFCKYSLGFL
ncbi:MAG: hypothetical protein WCG25_06350 [bacterium]